MESSINVRSASPEDAVKVVEFNRNMAEETEGKELDLAVLTLGVKEILSNPAHGFYLVAEIDGTVCGCLMVTAEWSDWRNGEFWWIQSVYVDREFRRRGVFSAMFAEARRQAYAADGVCGCRLYVEHDNEQAQATYRQMGFEPTSYKMYEMMFEGGDKV